MHVPRRILPLSWEEVYLLFDHWLQNGPGVDIENDDLCSHQTVKRCYKAEWKAALPFRRESTHAVCDTCQWFKEWRKKDAAGSTEAKKLNEDFVNHQADQMRDRDIDAAVRKNAAYHIQQADPPVNDWDDVLDFSIEAMEQAKFKVPKHSGA